MIPRKELLAKLATVTGALAPLTSPIPLNTHYWFTGKNLMAFNGRMAIMTPLATDFIGAVPRKIVPLLKSSRAEEIDITASGDDMVAIKHGKAKAELSMLPIPSNAFKFPVNNLEIIGAHLGVDAGRFVQNMEACLRSCGTMTHTIDMLGVTLVEDGKWLDMYATDADTMTATSTAYDGNLLLSKFRRVILPTDWCKQFVEMAHGLTELRLEINDEYAMLDCDAGTLYTAVIEPDAKPLPFRDQLNSVYTLSADNGRVKIPEDIIPVLERANIITMKSKVPPVVTMEVDGSDLTISAKSEGGELREMIHIGPSHRRVSTPINAKRVLEAMKAGERMVITEEAVIVTRDKWVMMVSPPNG